MPTRVKICGITRLEDAQLAIELGAAALGFNFYPPSPRYIPPARAQGIILRLPPFVATVGVFANETDSQQVAAVAEAASVSAVQLHGPAYPILDGALTRFRLIRAVAVTAGFQLRSLQALHADAFLLDALDARLPGGTGRSFDWTLARQASQFGVIILAGGLTPENVGQAMQEVRPYAVDVASGVESGPGVKDAAKLQAFFREVARADQSLRRSNRA